MNPLGNNTMTSILNERLITRNQLKAMFANVTDNTVHAWEKRGILSRVKMGGLCFYRESEIEKILNSKTEFACAKTN